jgi:hypothetical protein
VPILPPRGMAAAIAQGREERKALLDKVAAPWHCRRRCISIG